MYAYDLCIWCVHVMCEYDLCICVHMCAYVCICVHVLMCFQAQSSSTGNVCRVLILLPKIILFLLALLTPLVLIFLKNENEILVCIYRFAVCVIYINATLWNRNTNVLPCFSLWSIVPYSPCF